MMTSCRISLGRSRNCFGDCFGELRLVGDCIGPGDATATWFVDVSIVRCARVKVFTLLILMVDREHSSRRFG